MRGGRSFVYKARFFLGILFLFILLISIFGPHGWINQYRIRKGIISLEEEIAKIREENRLLEIEKEELLGDLYRLEMEARRLGMARDGEWVVEFSKKVKD